MSPIVLRIIRGDTYRARIVVKRDGAIADLTGCALVALIKADEATEDDDADIALAEGNGLTFESESGGIVLMELTPEQTALLFSTSIPVWKLMLSDADDRIYTVAAGDVIVGDDTSVDEEAYTATLTERATVTAPDFLTADFSSEDFAT